MPKILIIEDEPKMVKILTDNLALEGYRVVSARDGESGLRSVVDEAPEAVILDLMLPGMNGFEVCRSLRARGCRAAILILSAKDQEVDKVLGLELGADDYITKPFSVRELLARVKAF